MRQNGVMKRILITLLHIVKIMYNLASTGCQIPTQTSVLTKEKDFRNRIRLACNFFQLFSNCFVHLCLCMCVCVFSNVLLYSAQLACNCVCTCILAHSVQLSHNHHFESKSRSAAPLSVGDGREGRNINTQV